MRAAHCHSKSNSISTARWILFISIFFLSACSAGSKSDQHTPKNTATLIKAEELNQQGDQAWEKGHFPLAVKAWEKAIDLYQKKDTAAQMRLLDKLSQAYIATGKINKAQLSLETALPLAEELGDPDLTALLLTHLGSLHQTRNSPDLAFNYLQQAAEHVQAGNVKPDTAAVTYNHFGNYFIATKQLSAAIDAYKQGSSFAIQADKPLLWVTATINHSAALLNTGDPEQALSKLLAAQQKLKQIKDSHEKAYALLHSGLTFIQLSEREGPASTKLQKHAREAFLAARAIAEKSNDHRTLSYSFGYLGKLFEAKGQNEESLTQTRLALAAAQQLNAPDTLYIWQWQTGRLMSKLGRQNAAIDAYRRTIITLKTIQQEMDACSGEDHSIFRNTAGEVAYQLIDLLLRKAAKSGSSEETTRLLTETRDLVELLRVYELRNYFQDDCIDIARVNSVPLDRLSETAAIIYPIALPDRTELLVSLPDGLKQFLLPVDNETLSRETGRLRLSLEKRTTWEFLLPAQKLYDYLLRPILPELDNYEIDTLVFVPEGSLRTIPFAALHDGTEFLYQKFATAITPGLYLTDPQPLDRQNIQVLFAGLTKSVQNFPPLPFVKNELQAITNQFQSNVLVDESFVLPNFEESLKQKPFSILHVASHGQFKGNVEQTFLLGFDDKITMDKLNKFIGFLQFRQEPLDLIALSACETAAGDDLAALGIAGIAIKAGARSALATLWYINDEATTILIEEFYRQITDPLVTRASALRQAQLKLSRDPRYEHPAYWAPFLLINNWL